MVFIVAEIGINHNGNVGLAKRMIALSKESGASAVKFQMFDKEDYAGRKDIQKCWLSREQLIELKMYANWIGVEWFATPEKPEHIDFLESIGVERYKIRHTDCYNTELVERAALTGKQVIISVPDGADIERTLKPFVGKPNLPRLIHCPAGFPPSLGQMHLNAIAKPSLLVGLSSHYPGILPCLIAVALGAEILEVHVKLDEICIDSAVSLSLVKSYNELDDLATRAKLVEAML